MSVCECSTGRIQPNLTPSSNERTRHMLEFIVVAREEALSLASHLRVRYKVTYSSAKVWPNIGFVFWWGDHSLER